ncbi:hypothetical protein A2U01_0026532, partial [Trifolium medium]|nr:hypothetical protein [Trifolium medium]
EARLVKLKVIQTGVSIAAAVIGVPSLGN